MPEGRLDRIPLEDVPKELKPIVFLTSGTRGDVQPLTALARGLQDTGIAVRVAAPPAFQRIVEAASIPYAPLEGNPSDLLTTPGKQSALTFNENNPLHGVRSALEYLRAAQPVYKQMIENGWRVSKDASAIVIGLATIWGTSIAEALNVPCMGAFLQPVSTTGEFPSPLLPSVLRLGRTYNKLTYWLMSQAVYIPWRRVINRWRVTSLGLNPLPLFYSSFEKMDLITYGFSESVLPRPRDWPSSRYITGYWSVKNTGYVPSVELGGFLSAGKPFYFGFGSPGMHEPEALVELLMQAIQQAGIRAVLLIPTGVDLTSVNENIHILREEVPHGWLFPQMAGIVHHGGAGTTGEALKAGVPSLIVPLAVDQFFWGRQVHSLGGSPKAIPQRELTVEKLVRALNEMQDGRMKETARKLGERLRLEDGVANAARVIKYFIETRAG
jgi:UDP:flavonoid glycosyltransferase YjiC (YdhE family)